MNVSVVGCGYVGLVLANGLASLGKNVIAVDKDADKISSLKEGELSIYEPQLLEIHRDNLEKGNIDFTTNLKKAVEKSKVFFICVNTPSLEGGGADPSGVFRVTEDLARSFEKGKYYLVVIKSTVPVGTCRKLSDILEGMGLRKSQDFDVVSNPEFSKEGEGVKGFFLPDRIIVGCESAESREVMEVLFQDFQEQGVAVLFSSFETAELIKYASNAFLGVKISFVNEMAGLCEKLGVDIDILIQGMSMDSRINLQGFTPGPGYGGPCLPKDATALLAQARSVGSVLQLVEASERVNAMQRRVIVEKLREVFQGGLSGKCLGVLGLAFKANSDDVRNSSALEIVRELSEEGVLLQVYDPHAGKKAKSALGDLIGVTFCDGAYDAVNGSDAILILTEWEEFKEMDYEIRVKKLMRSPVLIDARNILREDDMAKWGYLYRGLGRKGME
ncbi:MAG: UDPglucose 6-dehydrogenase [Chlamydiales bacterium]|jgi:UDPglucose 6-dehydrogenase